MVLQLRGSQADSGDSVVPHVLDVLHVGAEGKTDPEVLVTAEREGEARSAAAKSPASCRLRSAATSLAAAAGGDSPSSPSSLLPDPLTALTGSLPKQLKASTERKEGYLSSLKVSRTGIKSAPAEAKGRGGKAQGPSPGKQRLEWEHRPRSRARPGNAGSRAPSPPPLRLITRTPELGRPQRWKDSHAATETSGSTLPLAPTSPEASNRTPTRLGEGNTQGRQPRAPRNDLQFLDEAWMTSKGNPLESGLCFPHSICPKC
ncbi:hypothetical protein HJG60_012133 [Phyllostomus discolor]|uniref:Uncharacterized protein n=1 Tax=Phyllostomus discolor TaxID=89673 RepID=A0A834DWF4_9CHIR|nr:hypothetical protein HJG60_012133 [Phyllostomus discolor]